MLGINGGELVLLLVVLVIVVGPERLPRFAEQLGVWVRTMRGVVRSAKTRVDEELGEQGADVDWASLDPRRYDPRRIVREALLEDLPAPISTGDAALATSTNTQPIVKSETATKAERLDRPVAAKRGAPERDEAA